MSRGSMLGLQVSEPGAAALMVLLLAFVVFVYHLVANRRYNCGPTATHMSTSLPGEILKIPSAWGDVYIRAFEPTASTVAADNNNPPSSLPPVVCLPGINAKLVLTIYSVINVELLLMSIIWYMS